jgi:hypothetical protein
MPRNDDRKVVTTRFATSIGASPNAASFDTAASADVCAWLPVPIHRQPMTKQRNTNEYQNPTCFMTPDKQSQCDSL